MPKLQLSFYRNFALKKEDLLKILRAASEPLELNDSLENLMQRTGLGNQKVRPMIAWATRAGLVKNKSLTPEAKIILNQDPYLQSINSDWFMHFYLSFGDKGVASIPENLADWGGWTYFVYTFLPQYKNFTPEELEYHSSLIFDEEQPKMLTKNLKIILRAYTETHALAACKFITLDGKQYQSGKPELPNPYLIGYFLAKLWGRDFSEQGSTLTKSVLEQKMGLTSVLAISPDALQEQLNSLEVRGVIEQRRAVPPFQIIPRWDNPLTLLEKAYDHA